MKIEILGEYMIVLANEFRKAGAISVPEYIDFVDQIKNILESCGCPVLIGYFRMSDTDREFYENSPFNHAEIREVA